MLNKAEHPFPCQESFSDIITQVKADIIKTHEKYQDYAPNPVSTDLDNIIEHLVSFMENFKITKADEIQYYITENQYDGSNYRFYLDTSDLCQIDTFMITTLPDGEINSILLLQDDEAKYTFDQEDPVDANGNPIEVVPNPLLQSKREIIESIAKHLIQLSHGRYQVDIHWDQDHLTDFIMDRIQLILEISDIKNQNNDISIKPLVEYLGNTLSKYRHDTLVRFANHDDFGLLKSITYQLKDQDNYITLAYDNSNKQIVIQDESGLFWVDDKSVSLTLKGETDTIYAFTSPHQYQYVQHILRFIEDYLFCIYTGVEYR